MRRIAVGIAKSDSDDADYRPVRPTITMVRVLVPLSVYFALLVLPRGCPEVGGTLPYLLSVPLVLLGLVAIGGVGARGILRPRRDGFPVDSGSKRLVVYCLAGLGLFAGAVLLTRAIPGSLPTGSHLLEFDSLVWKASESSVFARGDITARQKMLGSLLDRLQTGLPRSEIEELLGAPLDTPYFSASERDLIYVLGPERDRFVRLDSEWLLIGLDDSGGLERFEILRD